MEQSLVNLNQTLSKIPSEQKEGIQQSVDQLCLDIVKTADEAPLANATYIERADWMQSVDELLYSKKILDQKVNEIDQGIAVQEIRDYAANIIQAYKEAKKLDYDQVVNAKFVQAIDLTIKENRFEEFSDSVGGNLADWWSDGNTLLHLAAKAGLGDTVRTLAPLMRNPHEADKNGWTPLNLAVHSGDVESVRALLAIPGFDLNDNKGWGNSGYRSEIISLPIDEAADKGYAEIMRLLLNLPNVDLNSKRHLEAGWTPLMTAQGKGHVDTAEVIKLSGKDSISELIKSVKILTHTWELDIGQRDYYPGSPKFIKIGDLKIPGDGFLPRMAAEFMNTTFDKFAHSYPNAIPGGQIGMIEHAFNNIEPFSAEAALSDFRNGNPVLISTGNTGTPGHSIQVLFFDSYMMLCNKGDFSLAPIEAYKIDPTLLTTETLTSIKEAYKADSMDEGVHKIFGNVNHGSGVRETGPILESLNASRSEGIGKWIENLPHLSIKQKIGNCAWESLETAVYAIMAIQTAIEHNLEVSDSLGSKGVLLANQVHQQFSQWEIYTKLQAISQVYNSTKQWFLNRGFEASTEIDDNLIKVCDDLIQNDKEEGFPEERELIKSQKGQLGHLHRNILIENAVAAFAIALSFFNAYKLINGSTGMPEEIDTGNV